MKEFDIERIAELAMLTLTDEEKASLRDDMAKIVDFAGRIAEVADAAEETRAYGSLREDMTGESLGRDEALAEAPDARDGGFFVPKVVE